MTKICNNCDHQRFCEIRLIVYCAVTCKDIDPETKNEKCVNWEKRKWAKNLKNALSVVERQE